MSHSDTIISRDEAIDDLVKASSFHGWTEDEIIEMNDKWLEELMNAVFYHNGDASYQIMCMREEA